MRKKILCLSLLVLLFISSVLMIKTDIYKQYNQKLDALKKHRNKCVFFGQDTLRYSKKSRYQKTKFFKQDGFQPIQNITTNGWVFKKSKILNDTLNDSTKIVISKNPDGNEEYIVGILRKRRDSSGLYSYIDLLRINVSDMDFYINSTNFNTSTQFLGRYEVTGDLGVRQQIKDIDVVWKNESTVIITYAYYQLKQAWTGVYIDSYDIIVLPFDLSTMSFGSEKSLLGELVEGICYGVRSIKSSSINKVIIF
ncbi:MAG: hypothetical protein Q6363_007600, partial [Candidatus Njordarchaeota archaeon]